MRSQNNTRRTPRQEAILDHLLEMVTGNGLSGVTIKKIAARVGFSEAALYRHFPTKQALVLGLIDRLENMLLDPIREIAGNRSQPPSRRLELIIRHHTGLVRKHNSLPILLFAEASASGDPELIGRMCSIFHNYTTILTRVVHEGRVTGELTEEIEEDCLALLLMGTSSALAIRHRLMPDPAFEDRFEDKQIPFLISRILRDKGEES